MKPRKPTLHIGIKIGFCGRIIQEPNAGMLSESPEQSIYEIYANDKGFTFCSHCRTKMFTGKYSFLNTMDVDTSVVIPKSAERSLSTIISARNKTSKKTFEMEKEGENYRLWRRK